MRDCFGPIKVANMFNISIVHLILGVILLILCSMTASLDGGSIVWGPRESSKCDMRVISGILIPFPLFTSIFGMYLAKRVERIEHDKCAVIALGITLYLEGALTTLTAVMCLLEGFQEDYDDYQISDDLGYRKGVLFSNVTAASVNTLVLVYMNCSNCCHDDD